MSIIFLKVFLAKRLICKLHCVTILNDRSFNFLFIFSGKFTLEYKFQEIDLINNDFDNFIKGLCNLPPTLLMSFKMNITKKRGIILIIKT